MNGRILGVGVGPGAPDLLTLRAVNALRECNVVFAPKATDDSQSLALHIAMPHILPSCEIRELHFPMTKDAALLKNAWQNAAQELITLANAGKTVVFLTLGDALLYSTWGYVLNEIKLVAPNVRVESVPGITAMAACAAEVGKPLAEGSAPLTVWPGEPSESMPLHTGTFVFMKAARHLHTIQHIAAQNNKEYVAVRNCCLPNQGITQDLSTWENDTQYFTTVLCFPAKKENSR